MSTITNTTSITHSGTNDILPSQHSTLSPKNTRQLSIEVLSRIPLLHPISYPYTDLQGRILQLWKYKETLIASIQNPEGSLKILSGKRIHNALQPTEIDTSLLARLKITKLTTCQLGYLEETNSLYVWPYLLAAAKGDPSMDLAKARAQLAENRKHLEKADSENPLTHLEVAGREVRGEIFSRKEDGRPHSHANELLEYRQGTSRIIKATERNINEYNKALAKQEIDPSLREHMQKMRAEVVSLRDEAKKFHDSLISKDFPLTLTTGLLTNYRASPENII